MTHGRAGEQVDCTRTNKVDNGVELPLWLLVKVVNEFGKKKITHVGYKVTNASKKKRSSASRRPERECGSGEGE